jgi:hypothetical protein
MRTLILLAGLTVVGCTPSGEEFCGHMMDVLGHAPVQGEGGTGEGHRTQAEADAAERQAVQVCLAQYEGLEREARNTGRMSEFREVIGCRMKAKTMQEFEWCSLRGM